MATRATIKIEGVDYAKVYKHWDGDPESTLPFLEKFNDDFAKNRGDDPEYKFAQLLRASVRLGKEFSLDDSPYTGWGVLPFDSDAGQAYEYTLLPDGKVKVS
jgi:hypothetical protein